MELSQITLAAFAAFNALRLFSYFPQIVRIATDANGASAISFSTWFLWTGSHLATGAYAAVNLKDQYLTVASALFASCCLAVIALTAMKRRGLSRAHSAALQTAPVAKYPSENA